jgi:hypothetical protein
MYPSGTIAAMTAVQITPVREQLARGSGRSAAQFAGIGANSIAFGILLIFESTFGRGDLLAG